MDEIKTKKKTNIPAMVTGIVAVFAILIMALTLSPLKTDGVTGRATTNLRAVTSYVNAHSCSADSVCEANIVQTQDLEVYDGLDVHAITQLKGTTYIDGNLILSQLSGLGSGYACVSEKGTIFRSNAPCTKSRLVDTELELNSIIKNPTTTENYNSITMDAQGKYILSTVDDSCSATDGVPTGNLCKIVGSGTWEENCKNSTCSAGKCQYKLQQSEVTCTCKGTAITE